MSYKESHLSLRKSRGQQPHTQPALASEDMRLEIRPEARILEFPEPPASGAAQPPLPEAWAVSLLSLAPRCAEKVGHWASISWVMASIPH